MASTEAERRCPSCVFLPPTSSIPGAVGENRRNPERVHTSGGTGLLDEAYLDVTEDPRGIGSATKTARLIKEEISRVTGGLTSSAGVAPVMFVAKIASDYHKPNGLTVVTRRGSLLPSLLPVSKIPGVGPITAKHLAKLGIRTIGELFRTEEELLQKELGKFGRVLYDAARGRKPSCASFQERLSWEQRRPFRRISRNSTPSPLPREMLQGPLRRGSAGGEEGPTGHSEDQIRRLPPSHQVYHPGALLPIPPGDLRTCETSPRSYRSGPTGSSSRRSLPLSLHPSQAPPPSLSAALLSGGELGGERAIL